MIILKDEIESTLHYIINLPLWSIGRAGDLEWFSFGNNRMVVLLRDGKTKIVSDYALHVQCSWRLRSKDRIIVGSRDRFFPPGDFSYKDLDDFEWDVQGGNHLDASVTKLMENSNAVPFLVTAIQADEIGSIRISFNNEHILEVLPDISIASAELWRFFIPYSDKPHFVVTGHGLELE